MSHPSADTALVLETVRWSLSFPKASPSDEDDLLVLLALPPHSSSRPDGRPLGTVAPRLAGRGLPDNSVTGATVLEAVGPPKVAGVILIVSLSIELVSLTYVSRRVASRALFLALRVAATGRSSAFSRESLRKANLTPNAL